MLSFVLKYLPADNSVDIVSRSPFSSASKFSYTLVKGRYNLTFIKGAPEKILPFCTTYYDENLQIKDLKQHDLKMTTQSLSQKAIRLLAVAISETPVNPAGNFRDLRLLGIFGIQDAIRPNAASGVSYVMSAEYRSS